MTSEIQQTYYGWQHGEFSEQDVSQVPISISQAIDHGSISFGRFAVESLSWEKRSVFAHNERQEELEKFKSPGLVAQKKAYFEEYYKKIRALKAMQNLQTELSLEYGADGSISSQTGDDDEPAYPITRPIKMPESISQAIVEERSVEISFENVDVEPEYLKHVTATETFYLQGNCNNSLQMQMSDPESLAHSLSIGSSENIKLNEKNYAAKLTYKNDNVIETYSVPVDSPVLEKNKLNAPMPKENPTPAPLSKESATSARYISKTVHESMSERTKLSLGSKHLLQKTSDSTHIDLTLGNKTSCKPRSRDMPYVASHRSPTGLYNKVAVARTVSVSRERKGTILTDTKELIRSSKVLNRPGAGKFYTKGNLRVQEDTRVKATLNTVKNRALQSKSIGHGEFEMNLESKRKTGQKGETTEQLTSRSINLPSKNNPNLSGVAICKYGGSSCGDKSKKPRGNTTEKAPKWCQVSNRMETSTLTLLRNR
ncbi:hypothetical protein KSP39_PZI004256 [Platanthera zijinensis]|uniref:Protein WVD2-like 7 n=1 Tax=Platanthera zijinensis TaxID=2320716 RepID=A0AAP0BUV9_9ASPA